MLVIQGRLSIGAVVAFVAYLTGLYRPVTRLAGVYTSIQEAMGVFQRIVAWLDQTPEVRDLPGAKELGPVRGEIQFDDVTFAYNTGPPAGAGRRELHRPARPARRPRRPQRRGQNDRHLSGSTLLRPANGGGAHRRHGRAFGDAAVAGGPGRHGDAGHVPVPRHGPRQSGVRPAGRDARPSWRPPAAPPTSTISSPGCRKATTPSSASAASSCPAASGSAWPSPGPSSRTRAS